MDHKAHESYSNSNQVARSGCLARRFAVLVQPSQQLTIFGNCGRPNLWVFNSSKQPLRPSSSSTYLPDAHDLTPKSDFPDSHDSTLQSPSKSQPNPSKHRKPAVTMSFCGVRPFSCAWAKVRRCFGSKKPKDKYRMEMEIVSPLPSSRLQPFHSMCIT